MYTLVLIVIAIGGTENYVAVTHFRTVSETSCRQTAKLLVADSSREIQIKAFCVPRT